MELQQCGGEAGKESGHIHINQGVGHPITEQAVTIDGLPLGASYYNVGGQLHYSVPVKHVGNISFYRYEDGFQMIL